MAEPFREREQEQPHWDLISRLQILFTELTSISTDIYYGRDKSNLVYCVLGHLAIFSRICLYNVFHTSYSCCRTLLKFEGPLSFAIQMIACCKYALFQ